MSVSTKGSVEIIRNPQDLNDDTCATFVFNGEGHTLGNSLRYIISGNEEVEFCGYCIPHPSQNKINFRLQTKSEPVENVLLLGFQQLSNACDILDSRLDEAFANFRN